MEEYNYKVSLIVNRICIDTSINQSPVDVWRHLLLVFCDEYAMFAVVPSLAGHEVDAVFVRIDFDRLDGLNAFGVKAVKRDVVFLPADGVN